MTAEPTLHGQSTRQRSAAELRRENLHIMWRTLTLAWHAYAKDKAAVGALIFLAIVVLISIFAPYISPHDPTEAVGTRGGLPGTDGLDPRRRHGRPRHALPPLLGRASIAAHRRGADRGRHLHRRGARPHRGLRRRLGGPGGDAHPRCLLRLPSGAARHRHRRHPGPGRRHADPLHHRGVGALYLAPGAYHHGLGQAGALHRSRARRRRYHAHHPHPPTFCPTCWRR